MTKGWFGPKRVGFGISPRTWQGWAVVAAYVAGLGLALRLPVLRQSDWGLVPALALTVVFFLLIRLTYRREG